MSAMIIIIRILFIAASTFACWQLARLSYPRSVDIPQSIQLVYALIGFAISVAIIVMEMTFKRKFVRTLVATVFGLMIGILVTFVLVHLTRFWAGIFVYDHKEHPAINRKCNEKGNPGRLA